MAAALRWLKGIEPASASVVEIVVAIVYLIIASRAACGQAHQGQQWSG